MTPALVRQACHDDRIAIVKHKMVLLPERGRTGGKNLRHSDNGKSRGRR